MDIDKVYIVQDHRDVGTERDRLHAFGDWNEAFAYWNKLTKELAGITNGEHADERETPRLDENGERTDESDDYCRAVFDNADGSETTVVLTSLPLTI